MTDCYKHDANNDFFIIGTTPTISIALYKRKGMSTIPYDVSEAEEIEVILTQGNVSVRKLLTEEDVYVSGDNNNVVNVFITQEETFMFNKGMAEIQAREKINDVVSGGFSSKIRVFDSLSKEVI